MLVIKFKSDDLLISNEFNNDNYKLIIKFKDMN